MMTINHVFMFDTHNTDKYHKSNMKLHNTKTDSYNDLCRVN
ncbi:MAG: hypothetical protein BWX95_00350 [Bacteroidetes bacterium ADurb.Bin141]|nr:MAG: hypothetical protein BWX95_00350 [Bacteroidetes bacterium ADurb.Bin141]